MDAARVVSLFSGCGGLDLGFKEAGCSLVYACDNDPAAVQCYRHNIDGDAVQRDVTTHEFRDDIRAIGSCDVVLGGFPCQGFSKAGRKEATDSRNVLYREMLAAIDVLRPAVFLAENVDGMSQNFNGSYVKQIVRDFRKIGYDLDSQILNAAAFGVPQHRRRIFFVGVRNDLADSPEWPRYTHAVQTRNGEFKVNSQRTLWDDSPVASLPQVTIREAIGDLISLDADVPDHEVTNAWPSKYEHVFRAIGEGQKLCNVRHADTSVYTWQIPEVFGRVTNKQQTILETIGRNRRHKRYGDIPNGNPLPLSEIERLARVTNIANDVEELVEKGYLKWIDQRVDLKGAMFCSGLFKRPSFDAPAPTVLTNFHNPRYFLHPATDRPFSLRECARLQGFPDNFEFIASGISLVDGYRLVGNAVPPPLGKLFADSFAHFLETCLV